MELPVFISSTEIRGDFGLDIEHNIIHGSDSTESAETEIGLFFDTEEVLDYSRNIDFWITES